MMLMGTARGMTLIWWYTIASGLGAQTTVQILGNTLTDLRWH